jgi:hypothetical protein
MVSVVVFCGVCCGSNLVTASYALLLNVLSLLPEVWLGVLVQTELMCDFLSIAPLYIETLNSSGEKRSGMVEKQW